MLDIFLNKLSIGSEPKYFLLSLKSEISRSSLVINLDISLIPVEVFNILFLT